MSQFTAYFNGEWVPEDQVLISHTDRGFVTGDVVFDVERTFNGKSFRMKEHVDRLYRSLKYVRIDPGLSDREMLVVSEETIRRNEHLRAPGGDFNIRQFVTRGPGRSTVDAGPATVGVVVSPINFARYASMYESGAHAVVARSRSYAPDALDPKVKHYSRMNFNMADLEAVDVDREAWPILMDGAGNLTEGTGYNFFLVTDGVLRTPGDDTLLQGISRGAVFDIARQLGIPSSEEALQPYDLYTADEAFFCSTSFCILPMTVADLREVGDGRPGPVTRQLLAAWSEMVGVDIVDQAVQGTKSQS